MCGRRSRIGLRGIVIGSFLLLLLASPCFAAASWPGILGSNTEEAGVIEQAKAYSAEYLGEFSAAESTTPSEQSEKDSLEMLATQLGSLKAQQESLSQKARELESLSTTLSAQLEAYSETGEITEAEYQAVKKTLDGVVALNGSQAATIEGLNAEIASLEARLEDATSTKAYLMLDGIIGFDGNINPKYGVGLTLGTRLGENLMLELGADYNIGSTWQDALDFGMEDWTFRAGIGWMF